MPEEPSKCPACGADLRSDLVGYKEISRLTRRTLNELRVRSSRGNMPKRAHPDYPLWDKSRIAEWIRTDPWAGAKAPKSRSK